MTRAITALADRMIGLVAPRATAQAACGFCSPVFCYCQGARYYQKSCCVSADCKRYSCGACRFVGYGC